MLQARSGPESDWRRARRLAQQQAVRRRRRRRWLAAAVTAALLATAGSLLAAGLPAPKHATPRAAEAVTTYAAAARRAPPTVPGPPKATPKPGAEPVPILMYHVINKPFPDSPYPGLYVPPAEFAAQMHALARAGYHAVTLDQVRRYWLTGTPLPPRPIVLSFDNGYRSQYTVALPVLRSLGWVGVENLQLSGLPPSQGGLSHRQIRALVAAHWELDTQGFTHSDMVTLDAAALRHEIAVSRRTIRRLYGAPANWFCYPSGDYDPTVVAAVKAAGYVGATTVVPGWSKPSDDPYELPRLRVPGGTTPAGLLALIAGTRSNPPAPAIYTA